jgi:ATP-dependent protease ClpP protease subunit
MTKHIIYQGDITCIGVQRASCMLLEASGKHMKEPIIFCICSGGGDVSSGMYLFNFIRMLSVDVHTHAMGACGSIAATIFMAGKHRTSSGYSNFSLHAASGGPEGVHLISESATDLLSKPFIDVLGWSSEICKKYFSTMKESFLTVDEALTLGIVHEKCEIANINAENTSIVNVCG